MPCVVLYFYAVIGLLYDLWHRVVLKRCVELFLLVFRKFFFGFLILSFSYRFNTLYTNEELTFDFPLQSNLYHILASFQLIDAYTTGPQY